MTYSRPALLAFALALDGCAGADPGRSMGDPAMTAAAVLTANVPTVEETNPFLCPRSTP